MANGVRSSFAGRGDPRYLNGGAGDARRRGPTGRRPQEESTMAERQETSVMASIQDILRDAQLREEQEKLAAQRRAEEEERARLDAIRRQQEDEERRIREEEEERQRKIYEEQRRQAEIVAMQEAAVQRARMEAEAQARLAEMSARQEHERHLAALNQDKHKKRLFWAAASASGILVLALAIGGYAFKVQYDKQQKLQQELTDIQNQKADADRKAREIQAQLDNTKDPETIARLQAQLKEQQDKVDDLNRDLQQKGGGKTGGAYYGGAAKPGAGTGGGGGGGGGGAKPPCACAGDPLCSCL